MYILAAILKKMTAMMVKYRICVFMIVFFVIFGPENVCLDAKFFFLRELETEIFKHVYSGGHLRSKVKFA